MQKFFQMSIDVLHSHLKKYNEKLIFNYLKKSLLKEFMSDETHLNFKGTLMQLKISLYVLIHTKILH